MTGMLRFRDVSKRYGQQLVIEALSLDCEPGSLLGITGPSGSGKTTFLRLAAGLESADAGSVEVEGRLACVFQEPRLLPWRTALENVALALEAGGRGREEAQDCAMEWLEKTGVGEAEKNFPATLSGGMAQRVSLARALAVEPDVLLLDEPFSALDSDRREQMRGLLAGLRRERPGMIVLYVTHHPSDIGDLANRILRIEAHGLCRVLESGK